MSSEFLLALAIGIVLGAAIVVSGMVHGYVGAVIEHGKKHYSDTLNNQTKEEQK